MNGIMRILKSAAFGAKHGWNQAQYTDEDSLKYRLQFAAGQTEVMVKEAVKENKRQKEKKNAR